MRKIALSVSILSFLAACIALGNPSYARQESGSTCDPQTYATLQATHLSNEVCLSGIDWRTNGVTPSQDDCNTLAIQICNQPAGSWIPIPQECIAPLNLPLLGGKPVAGGCYKPAPIAQPPGGGGGQPGLGGGQPGSGGGQPGLGGGQPGSGGGQPSGGGGGAITIPNPLGGKCDNLPCVFDLIANFLFTIATPILTIVVLWAAFLFLTSGGNETRVATARSTLVWGAVGFAVVLLSKGLALVLRQILGG